MTSTYAETENQNEESRKAPSEPPRAAQFQPCLKYLGRFSIALPTFLIVIYLALWAFYPWRPLAELDSPGWIVDFADQVDMMMTARNPRLVVLGSSLILAAPRRLRRPTVFEQEFSQAAGYPIETACMAVPGAIASDQDFILEQLLAHHKKPTLIVYTYSARDFMDNTIEGKISNTPTRRVLTFIDRRSSFMPRSLTVQAISDCLENHAAFIDLVRRHVLRETRSLTCRVTGHPDNLWIAARQSAAPGESSKSPDKIADLVKAPVTASVTAPGASADGAAEPDESLAACKIALAKDLDLYQRRYNPQNKERIDDQYHHLENLLKMAVDNKIQIALVGMPLSPANRKLLPADGYQTMSKRVAALANSYHASCIDLNNQSGYVFEQDQFLDSAHLSTPGARAFLPLFVKSVVGSKAFQDSAFRQK